MPNRPAEQGVREEGVREPVEQPPVHEVNPGRGATGGDGLTYAELDWSQTKKPSKKPSKAGATGGDGPKYAELDWSQTKKPSEGAPNKPEYTERDGKLIEMNGDEERILNTEPPSFRDHPHARWFVKDAKTGAWYRTKYDLNTGMVLRHKEAILTPPGGSKPNTQSETSRDPQPGTSGLQPTFESTMLNAAKKLDFKVDTLEQFQQMHPREYELVANKIRSKFPDQGKVGGATGGTQPQDAQPPSVRPKVRPAKPDVPKKKDQKPKEEAPGLAPPREATEADFAALIEKHGKAVDATAEKSPKKPEEQSNEVQKKKDDESREPTEADFEALLEEHGQGTDVKAKRNLGKRLYATLISSPILPFDAGPRAERAEILKAINSIGYNFKKIRDARKAIPEIYLEVKKYMDHQRRIENPWRANGFWN